jgi:hypothetical protein
VRAQAFGGYPRSRFGESHQPAHDTQWKVMKGQFPVRKRAAGRMTT